MTPLELSTKAQDVIRKVEKLLALANDPNTNEHQASAAAAKAQELLVAYNLDMEECGNQDFMWNLEPGTTSRRRREAEAQWERDFPEQAAEAKARRAKEDADWLKKEERNAKRRTGNHRYRKATAAEERAGLGTYRDGYEKANDVNLSSQVDQTTTKGRLKK